MMYAPVYCLNRHPEDNQLGFNYPMLSEPHLFAKQGQIDVDHAQLEAQKQLEYQFLFAKRQREIDLMRSQLEHIEVLEGMQQLEGVELEGMDRDDPGIDIFDECGHMDMSVPELTDVCDDESSGSVIANMNEVRSSDPLPLGMKGSEEMTIIGDDEICQLACEEMTDKFEFLTEAEREKRRIDEVTAENNAIRRRFAAQKERTGSEGDEEHGAKELSKVAVDSTKYGQFYARKRLLLKDNVKSKEQVSISNGT
ncbi:MAG: hypothetical protein ACRDL7_06295 [Gaiellaceae bacterium]